jgi:uncharacterized membrane protein
MKKKGTVSLSIPLGAILSFGILIYLLVNNIWNMMSYTLKFLVVIGLIVLFFCGEVKFSKSKVDKDEET